MNQEANYVVTPTVPGSMVSITTDNAAFDVESDASFNLTGSSNEIVVENSREVGIGAAVIVSGDGNTVVAAADSSRTDFDVTGNRNTVTVNDHSYVTVSGSWNTVNTLGAQTAVDILNYTTVNAADWGDIINVGGTGNTINANQSSIRMWHTGSNDVNGDNDTIDVDYWAGNDPSALQEFKVTGSGNAINIDDRCAQTLVSTATDTISTRSDGSIVVTGGFNPGAITVTGGKATLQLGDGNVVNLSNVYSGQTFEYVDATGAATSTMLMDTNLLHLGGSLYQVLGSASARLSNTTFVASTPQQFSLKGNLDQVVLSDGSTISLEGDGDTVVGTNASRTNVTLLNGTNNVIAVGANSTVTDSAVGTSVTVGANSVVVMYDSTDSTVTATQGGTYIGAGVRTTINANNDTIFSTNAGVKISGNGNQIQLAAQGYSSGAVNVRTSTPTVDLTGSNNSIAINASFDAADATAQSAVSTSKDSLSIAGNGSIIIAGSVNPAVTLTGGIATVQLGDGNTVTTSNVYSGATLDYIDGNGTKTTSTLMDSNLLHLGGSLYQLFGDANAKMDNSIFAFAGDNLSMHASGSNDQFVLTSGSGLQFSGNSDTVIGTNASGAYVQLNGANNLVSVGANSNINDFGSGDTLTVGANSWVAAVAANTTVNATQGGAGISISGSGSAKINANNGELYLMGGNTVSVQGNGNVIDVWGPGETVTVQGSGNSLLMDSTSQTVLTSSSSLSRGDDGTIIVTGSVDPGTVTLTSGTATVNLGNGNVATLSGVSSGAKVEYIDASGVATWSALQDTSLVSGSFTSAHTLANQLVAAMASYTNADSGAASFVAQQATNDSQHMLAASLH
ncbi:beta strand repeat-containing protein [Burkholderia sp. 8Y]|uniref:beta strand repeat-containing protein n=1 Tax=Burkholderia sp. 8Y TaxID=2653133 RepID=UPI001359B974|nr:hypothetical protein [Burkholderia sp. 8Y]